MENHNILITGAAGLIGSKFFRLLSPKNYVTAIDNYYRGSYKHKDIINIDCERFVYEYNTDANFDFIFHFAAINGTNNFYDYPNKVIDNNVQSDLAIFQLCKLNPNVKLLYCSSSELVSNSDVYPTAEVNEVLFDDVSNPRYSYKLAKVLGENYLYNSNIKYNIVRFFNVIGEEDTLGHFLPDIKQKINSNNYDLIGYDETRCFSHVDDIIHPVIRLMLDYCNKTVNIGSSDEISVLDAATLYSKTVLNVTPTWNLIQGKPGSTKIRVPDLSLIKSLIPDYKVRTFKEILETWQE